MPGRKQIGVFDIAVPSLPRSCSFISLLPQHSYSMQANIYQGVMYSLDEVYGKFQVYNAPNIYLQPTGSGAGLTNIPIAGVTGLTDALDGKLSTNGVTAGIIAAAGGVTNGMPQTLTMTNLTTMADGVYGVGTNGVFFTRSGTNYWILLQ